MEHFLWTEKWRPQKVSDVILPSYIKDKFMGFVAQKNMPNLLLVGPPGLGKTTIALATLNEMGSDYIKINAALSRGIDVVRSEIMQFASTVSFIPGRKFILLDEFDRFLPDAQGALNAFIEEYAGNCGFIFTCNNPNKIIASIHSRCDVIDFKITKSDFSVLAKEFYTNLLTILDREGVDYDRPVLVDVIKRHYPDWRKTLNVLQSYSARNKKIDLGILGQKNVHILLDLVPIIRSKNWNEMRKWVGENFGGLPDISMVARQFLKETEAQLDGKSVAMFIDLANEYDYRNYFVVDKEVNLVAFLSRVMSEMIWK